MSATKKRMSFPEMVENRLHAVGLDPDMTGDVIVKYERAPDREPITVVAISCFVPADSGYGDMHLKKEGDDKEPSAFDLRTFIGVARCSKSDNFSRPAGRQIALARAVNQIARYRRRKRERTEAVAAMSRLKEAAAKYKGCPQAPGFEAPT